MSGHRLVSPLTISIFILSYSLDDLWCNLVGQAHKRLDAFLFPVNQVGKFRRTVTGAFHFFARSLAPARGATTLAQARLQLGRA